MAVLSARSNEPEPVEENKAAAIEVREEDGFVRFLDDLKLPGEIGAEIIGFRRRARELDNEQQLLDVISEFIDFISRIVKAAPVPEAGGNAFEHIRELLLQLVEWLPVDDSFHDDLNLVKEKILGLTEGADFKSTLRAITSMISDQ